MRDPFPAALALPRVTGRWLSATLPASWSGEILACSGRIWKTTALPAWRPGLTVGGKLAAPLVALLHSDKPLLVGGILLAETSALIAPWPAIKPIG